MNIFKTGLLCCFRSKCPGQPKLTDSEEGVGTSLQYVSHLVMLEGLGVPAEDRETPAG